MPLSAIASPRKRHQQSGAVVVCAAPGARRCWPVFDARGWEAALQSHPSAGAALIEAHAREAGHCSRHPPPRPHGAHLGSFKSSLLRRGAVDRDVLVIDAGDDDRRRPDERFSRRVVSPSGRWCPAGVSVRRRTDLTRQCTHGRPDGCHRRGDRGTPLAGALGGARPYHGFLRAS
jgi:hypothetical protein